MEFLLFILKDQHICTSAHRRINNQHAVAHDLPHTRHHAATSIAASPTDALTKTPTIGVTMVKKFLGLRGNALNWAVSTIAGCDFLLFGYGALLPESNIDIANASHKPY